MPAPRSRRVFRLQFGGFFRSELDATESQQIYENNGVQTIVYKNGEGYVVRSAASYESYTEAIEVKNHHRRKSLVRSTVVEIEEVLKK